MRGGRKGGREGERRGGEGGRGGKEGGGEGGEGGRGATFPNPLPLIIYYMYLLSVCTISSLLLATPRVASPTLMSPVTVASYSHCAFPPQLSSTSCVTLSSSRNRGSYVR